MGAAALEEGMEIGVICIVGAGGGGISTAAAIAANRFFLLAAAIAAAASLIASRSTIFTSPIPPATTSSLFTKPSDLILIFPSTVLTLANVRLPLLRIFISDLGFLLVVEAFNISASILSCFFTVPIVFKAFNVIVSPLILPATVLTLLFSMEPSVAFKSTSPIVFTEPLNKRSPLVAVAVKSPPIVELAKPKSISLTIVALPLPLVTTATVPSIASVPRLITPLLAFVVAKRLPPTVTVPLSVIPDALPLIKDKSPPIFDAAISRAVVPLSTTA